MPNQTVIDYYDDEELNMIREIINSVIGTDYAEYRKKFAWHSTDGRTIPYTDMFNQHIMNIYTYFTKKINDKLMQPGRFRQIKTDEIVTFGNFKIMRTMEHALILIEGYYRGIIEFPTGVTDVIRLRENLQIIMRHSKHYAEPQPSDFESLLDDQGGF